MRFPPILAILTLIFIIGCASSSPVTTDLVLGTVDHSAASGNSNHVLWGVWDVSIDPDTLDVGTVPVRNAEFTANVTRFMQPPSSPVTSTYGPAITWATRPITPATTGTSTSSGSGITDYGSAKPVAQAAVPSVRTARYTLHRVSMA